MEAQFTSRKDGQVDVDLGPEWRLFTEALNDCVSSLPPRGATGNGPSTYWVDVASIGLDRALASGTDRPFTWGNITLLRLNHGRVEARYDFDEEDVPGQFLDVDDLRRVLDDWRARIDESAAASTSPLPETYRRNPTPERPI
ncbi:hypothetical protein [Pedococcus dokdonensis]|uniref:hypothetical protein n=1 Tax=Pedococcus dokdonensis TaxID=443156 RepID=UPI0012FE5C65|nr:hypothetical protein [Pedococcus dokdonensis]